MDPRTGKPLRSLPGHEGRVAEIVVAPDGRQAITAAGRAVLIWALPAGTLSRTIDVPTGEIFDIALDPAGKTLAVTGTGGQAQLYSLDGTVLQTMTHGGPRVLTTAFSPDGGRVATAGDDGTIKVWNVADGKLGCTMTGHSAAVGGVAIAPDGQILASASDDRTVKLWHIGECRLLNTLSLHQDEVWSVRFSPDGSLLLSGGKDNVMGVWGMPGGWLRQRVDMGEGGGTLGLAFSPDGASAVTTERRGAVWTWSVAGQGRALPIPPIQVKDDDAAEGPTPEDRAYSAGLKILDGYHGNGYVLAEAETHFKGMLTQWPGSSRAKAGLANVASQRAFLRGDNYDPTKLADALRLVDEALAADPTFSSALCTRAWILHDEKDHDGARRALDAVLKVAPARPCAVRLRAKLQKEDRDLPGAEKTLVDFLSRPVEHTSAGGALEDLAVIDEERGDLETADQARRRQIELVPESAWAKGDYASFLIRKGDANGAIVMAQRALSQLAYGVAKDTLARAYCAQGEGLLWQDRRADEALRSFQAALAASPAACGLYGLGAYYQYQGVAGTSPSQLLQARKLYEQAVAAEPENKLARDALKALE